MYPLESTSGIVIISSKVEQMHLPLHPKIKDLLEGNSGVKLACSTLNDNLIQWVILEQISLSGYALDVNG